MGAVDGVCVWNLFSMQSGGGDSASLFPSQRLSEGDLGAVTRGLCVLMMYLQLQLDGSTKCLGKV